MRDFMEEGRLERRSIEALHEARRDLDTLVVQTDGRADVGPTVDDTNSFGKQAKLGVSLTDTEHALASFFDRCGLVSTVRRTPFPPQ
jgi:hypothetical protein